MQSDVVGPMRILRYGLLLFVAATVVMVAWDELRGATAAAAATAAATGSVQSYDESARLAVLFFFSDKRCAMCTTMEAGTKAAIERYFVREREEGEIVFQALNWQNPQSSVYVEAYDLLGNGVILQPLERGHPTARWKSIDDIWLHAHDHERVVEFVRSELARALGDGLGSGAAAGDGLGAAAGDGLVPSS